MKTQEQIIFENVYGRHVSGYCWQYPKNPLNWLYAYNLRNYDTVTHGDGKIHSGGKLLATYTFDEKLNMPIFEFTDNAPEHLSYYQKVYLKQLNTQEADEYIEMRQKLREQLISHVNKR